MAYTKKTWLARLGQGLNKFIFNGGTKVTLDSSPDVVTQEGTPLSADNMNDLEDRIEAGFTDVDDSITSLKEFEESDYTTSVISGASSSSTISGSMKYVRNGNYLFVFFSLNVTLSSPNSSYLYFALPDLGFSNYRIACSNYKYSSASISYPVSFTEGDDSSPSFRVFSNGSSRTGASFGTTQFRIDGSLVVVYY